jgi:hypothetical protein
VTAALALGGTRQGEPRRDKQSGQGRPSAKSQGQHQGVSWWPIDRRQQCHRSCQTASSDARFAASSWRRGGRGVGVTATSKPFTMPTIRMHQSTYSYVPEMRGQSPCPYALQRSPKREASAACSSCEMLLASWQTCHGTEARRNWSTRRSAWQASKKKILGNLTLQHPDDDGFYDEQRGIRLRFRRLFTSMPLSDVAFVPLCCYVRDWAHRGTMGLVLVLLGRTEAGRRTNWRRSLPGDQFAKSAVSPDCLEF